MSELMRKEFDQKAELVLSLSKDCNIGLEMQEQDPQNPYLRRSFVRTFFAYLEGSNHQMKHLTLLLHRELQVDFNDEERALLREETYTLDHQGKATTTQKFPGAIPNLRFTLESFARLSELSFPPDFYDDGNGFEEVKAAIGIRNRLMHPKNLEDLIVTDEEWQTVLNARLWYDMAVLQLFQNSRLRERLHDIEEQRKATGLN